jgi:ABC-type sugar transport system substrate-binding protein
LKIQLKAFRDSTLRVAAALLSTTLLTTATANCNDASAKQIDCPVGVNVNSFQNFGADKQVEIVNQLKNSGVKFVRITIREDEKSMQLLKRLQNNVLGCSPILALNTSQAQ